MPFCPKCRFEYRASGTRCPICDVELVSELPPRQPGRAELWVQDKLGLAARAVELTFRNPLIIYVVLGLTTLQLVGSFAGSALLISRHQGELDNTTQSGGPPTESVRLASPLDSPLSAISTILGIVLEPAYDELLTGAYPSSVSEALHSRTYWIQTTFLFWVGVFLGIPGCLVAAMLYHWLRQACDGHLCAWSGVGTAIKSYFPRLYGYLLLLTVLWLLGQLWSIWASAHDAARWFDTWVLPLGGLAVCLIPYSLVAGELPFWPSLWFAIRVFFRRIGTLGALWSLLLIGNMIVNVCARLFGGPDPMDMSVGKVFVMTLEAWPFELARALLGLFLAMAFMLIVIEERKRLASQAQLIVDS